MKKNLNPEAAVVPKSHRRRAAWQGFVRTMAMVVIFCTTYALILPAITMQPDLICPLEEHTHTDGCCETILTETLICTVPEMETETHAHDETCWTQPALICSSDDGETHQHDDTCWSAAELICTVPEVRTETHVHDEACWMRTEEIVLTCTLQEHTHEDACYKQEVEAEDGTAYTCGYTAHTHGEACYDAEGSLICSIPAHTHEAGCSVSQVDTTADLESAADWEVMIAQLDFTGSWREDLLTVAQSQVGYTESAANCVLDGDELRGYTRYGDWYGNPYMAWDDVFLAFCLHYAGIPDDAIPGDSDTDRWLARLVKKDLVTGIEDGLPQPGDIVFCKDSSGKLYPAVVLSAESPNLDTLLFRVIAGDVKGKVDKILVNLDAIAAICDPDRIQNPPAPENETEPEATEPDATEPEAQPVVHTAETENYIVTVTHPASLNLPAGAELRVTEYAKDSEIYLQRCREAGYELEWLLNIGFFLGEDELTLTGDFDVVVTSKNGDALGQDITHFADSGTERLDADAEGEEVSFTSGGFSDFGGGVATLAISNSFSFITVNPTQLQEGVDYVIYANYNNHVTFLVAEDHPTANLHNPALQVSNSGLNNAPYNQGSAWSLTASQMGTNNSDHFTWRIVRRSGNTYLVNQYTKQELVYTNGWFHLDTTGTAQSITSDGAGARLRAQGNNRLGLRYDGEWRGSWTNDRGQQITDATTVYFAAVNTGSGSGNGKNYPHAVHTGTVEIDRLRFYNLAENGDKGVGPLAGCVFEVTGANGYKATVVSGNDPELHLPSDIPDGEYTIREIAVPEGYVRDHEWERTFVVEDGALVSDRTIGTFINHNLEQLETSKTAEVEDYANRIYQIDMAAKSNMRTYEMDPMDVLFVVDKSNSMLFPSGLNETGKSVTLRKDGVNNAANMEALNLDKSQVYYIIADPTGTSTVWAVWHDGTAWMTQDASYYAKAKHANEPGYQDDNETVIFPEDRSYAAQADAEPEGVRSNGGGLGRDLSGSSLGKHLDSAANDTRTYQVYTSTDEYNRLHYLEEALVNLIYQMADVNDKNRVTLTRFTKEVASGDCFGPVELNPDNVEELATQVQSIKTSGGTRQDIALKHVYQEHLNDDGEHYSDFDHTYTLLITDGAPVLSSDGGLTNLGGADDAATTTGDTVYGQIKGWANRVKTRSHLMTVGLGMESVEAGKQVLAEIASDQNHYCAMDDASELLAFIQNLLFEGFRPKDSIHYEGDIVDEISNSFYPIAWVYRDNGIATGNRVLTSDSSRDWVLLESGDWITLSGMYTTAGAADAAGQLLQREDGTFYVQWTDQTVSGDGWKGTFYVKAKEDFIGGNAIDTNKEASVTVDGSVKKLATPTVNVRLLDMNEMNSEVTVYLGDLVNAEGDSPLDSLKYFYENTVFTKLIADGGDILNKINADSALGLEEAVFYLRYAMGADLTEEQWSNLANGDTIQVPYIYDDASSHGNVGYFTFKLEKNGLGSNYAVHESVTACQPGGTPLTGNCDHPAETYTLRITYTAYRLGESGRPETNVHNGSAGPGTEVGTGTTVRNGLGTLVKNDVHEVHVISGKIEILKRFADGVTDPNDRTFTFTLHRTEDGENTANDVTKTITIPAGQTEGSAVIVFDNLRRGTYTVTEAVDADYTVAGLTVLDTTNSYTEPPIGGTGTQLTAVMGNNIANENVIGKANASDRYVSYIDPVNGVYAAAEFTNAPIVYTAELPVEKLWDDGGASHLTDTVYVVLYLNDAPVLDGDGNARILRLDEANGFKGIFTVTLADKDDSLSNYNYSIREVSRIRTEPTTDWQPAILENDGSTLVYYELALAEGKLLTVGGRSYLVKYSTGGDGQLIVTNIQAVELPRTGGVGTHLYTISGLLLLMAAALIYGYSQRREKERGASE